MDGQDPRRGPGRPGPEDLETLNDLTAGRGPDACIDAVGLESHIDVTPLQVYDRAKQAIGAESDRPHALREAIMACANGGVVSVIGVYGGLVDKFPMGSFMTDRCGCAPVSATCTATWRR